MGKEQLLSALQQIRDIVDEALGSAGQKAPRRKAAPQKSHQVPKPSIAVDFEKPGRPFIKQYSKGLSGTKKFVLLVSWLAKGDAKKEVPIVEIQKHWKRMKARSLLGLDFNDFYPTNAKDHDWVESRKKGFYNLRPSWKEIFEKANG